MLFVDVPEGDRSAGDAIASLEAPRGMGGIFERRRIDKHCHQLERDIAHITEVRFAALEKRLEGNPEDFEAQRAMGILAMIDDLWERANAHFDLAHRLNPNDFETNVNYAITLAHRGQLQPAIDLLQKARAAWPRNPAILFNLALVALQARRAPLVQEAITELETLWVHNAALAQDFHDEAQTLRGLAFLLDNKPNEARAALELAARHQVSLAAKEDTRHDLETGEIVGGSGPASSSNGGSTQNTGDAAGVQVYDAPADINSDENAGIDEFLQLEGKDTDADLLNNLGIAEAAAGDFHKAVVRLGAAMRLEPGNARVHNNLGVLAYGQGQLQAAFQHIDLARQIEEFIEQPEPVTFNHLGVVLSAMGRSDDSLQEFQRAGSDDRAEFEVWYNLGRAYIEHGKPDKGVDYLRRAFQANQNHPDVHVVLGAAYLLRGQAKLYPEALKHFKRALQLNPRHRIAFADLALELLDTDQVEPASRVVQEALKAHPKSSEAFFLLAILLLRNATGAEGEQIIARAATLFNRAFENRPDLLVCLYNMALCQYVIGFRDAAAQQLEAVVKRDPSLAPAYYLMGVGHAEGKRWAEALAAWQQAAHYEAGNPDLHANMAYIYYQRGDWPQAINLYFKAHTVSPTEPYFLSALGLAYARSGQIAKSIESFDHSLRLDPRDPITHSNLGLAYYIKNDVEKAVNQWRVVSQLDAAYALRREEEQERKQYDESGIALRPFNWRARVINMAPILPRPHTHLVPGYNARAYRFAISDPELLKVKKMRDDLTKSKRMLGWMSAKT
jgi:tetratricopeptide (TPR) repeat protein